MRKLLEQFTFSELHGFVHLYLYCVDPSLEQLLPRLKTVLERQRRSSPLAHNAEIRELTYGIFVRTVGSTRLSKKVALELFGQECDHSFSGMFYGLLDGIFGQQPRDSTHAMVMRLAGAEKVPPAKFRLWTRSKWDISSVARSYRNTVLKDLDGGVADAEFDHQSPRSEQIMHPALRLISAHSEASTPGNQESESIPDVGRILKQRIKLYDLTAAERRGVSVLSRRRRLLLLFDELAANPIPPPPNAIDYQLSLVYEIFIGAVRSQEDARNIMGYIGPKLPKFRGVKLLYCLMRRTLGISEIEVIDYILVMRCALARKVHPTEFPQWFYDIPNIQLFVEEYAARVILDTGVPCLKRN